MAQFIKHLYNIAFIHSIKRFDQLVLDRLQNINKSDKGQRFIVLIMFFLVVGLFNTSCTTSKNYAPVRSSSKSLSKVSERAYKTVQQDYKVRQQDY
ncbi:MAG: hypothetical protein V3U87_12770, partial [Methylococcaceae bacterium]